MRRCTSVGLVELKSWFKPSRAGRSNLRFTKATSRTPSSAASPALSPTFNGFQLRFSSNVADQEVRSNQRKKPRSPKATNSLRRVAVEAERSQGGVLTKHDFAETREQDRQVKIVTAYCATEQYDISAASKILQSIGYKIDPYKTGLYPQVVHIQTLPSKYETAALEDSREHGDIFVFPSGTVVTWDVDEEVVVTIISNALSRAASNAHLERMETEDLEYYEDRTSHKSSVIGDLIKLGTMRNLDSEITNDATKHPEISQETETKRPEINLILAKIAFSSGLARSVKLAVLESTLDRYLESTREIPTLLSQGSRLPFTRSFVLRKTGELLSARAQLNLYSELTDSLPDLFWDSRHELGLEGYFEQIGKTLDVNVRIRALNQRMDYAQEIATVLREQLSEKHGLALEWSIIILISIEVIFEIIRNVRERVEKEDPESVESLAREYYKRALAQRET